MAKKVSENKITDLSQDWGLDTTNGLPYSGQSVQEFIKEGISSANTAYAERFGAVYFDPSTYTLYGFKNAEDRAAYLSGGPTSLIIGQEVFNFTGTINQVKIINQMSGNNLYFTNTAEKAELTVGFISQQKGITDADWTEILEDFYVTVSVDKGSSGSFTDIEVDKLVLNGNNYTVDVKKYVAFGSNRVRITVTGAITQVTSNYIFNVNLTSMYLSPSNFTWNKPFVEGETYNLGGVNIGGNIQKVLKVRVTNDELGYTQTFEQNIGTATYITNSYFFKGWTFPETGTGVYKVEMWLDANGLESDHLTYNIICISEADKTTASLININEIFEASNGTEADLFKYSIYNKGIATGNPYFKISKDGVTNREETLEGVITSSIQTYSAALEFESEEASFDIVVDASIGESYQQAVITIDNSASFPAVADASFYMNAATRSNNQTNRDKFINEVSGAEIETTYSDIAWVDGTDGWTVDESGRKCLLLPARSKMTVNVQPLALMGQGKTLEFAFKVANAADYNENIITIADQTEQGFRGIQIKPKNVCIHSKDLYTNDLAQSYNLKDEEFVHLVITLVKNYKTNYGNLAQIYVNGVKTTSFSFTGTDDFTAKANLVLGSDTADLYIYKMHVYENGFGWQDAVQNYINCLPGTIEKMTAWNKIISVIDDSYNLDYDAIYGKYNTMVIEMLDNKPLPDKLNPSGDNPPKCNLEINIVDQIEGELDEDFTQFFSGTPILNQTIEGQGTTAMTYYRWNFRWKMDKTYNKRRITAKKNVASSMHSHKMGATRLYNDLHNAVVGPNDANARVAVFQYPVYGFVKTLVEGTTDQYNYTPIGLYTIGPDKGDKPTFGFNNAEFESTLMHLEGTDHTPMAVGFDYPWSETQYIGSKEAMGAITSDGSISAAWEVGAAGEYDPKDNPTEVKAMLDAEFRPAYEVVYNNSTCILGVTQTLSEINADAVNWRKNSTSTGKSYSELEFWTDGTYDLYYYNTQYGDFRANGVNLLTQLGIDASELSGLTIDEKNEFFKSKRRENFIANWENYWDKDDAIFHDVILEIIAASDNFKKNNYPYKFKPLAQGGRWCRRQDDLDSIFDVNNQGFAAKLYSVLMGDKTATGSGSVFRGENSIFHTLIHECFKDEKKQMAHRIFDAMAELSPYGSSQIDRLIGYIQSLFWDKAQDYFTKSAYNIDAEWTYEEAWPLRTQGIYKNDVDPLQQSLGSHIEAERNWVELRMVFMASYYNWGPFATDNGDDASTGQVSFRAAGGKTYTITPALDLNPTILIGQSDLATYGDRVLAGTPVEVTVPDMGNNDTHVYIQGTDYISSLGDLSDLQVSADNPVLTIASKRLRTLKTGDETAENVTSNVRDLGMGYCPSLEEIDSRNLASLTGTVDLTQCPRLRKALFEGTNSTNIQIAPGSKIEELSLPDTITTISLIKLPNLTQEKLSYNTLNSLSYLRFEDNAQMDGFEMLKNAYVNSPALKNIRVTGFNYAGNADDVTMIATFATAKDENGNPVYMGIDDEGNSTLDLPVLDGVLTLDGYLYESDANTVRQYYPNLNIDALGFYMDFEDPETLRILLANMINDDNIGISREQAAEVTNIGTWFRNNAIIERFDELESFTGVTSLANEAFYNCINLKSINVNNIETLGSRAFNECTSLVQDINMPNLTSMSVMCFLNSGITSFTAPLLKIIPGYSSSESTFMSCTNLTKVEVPLLENIGNYVFYGCTSLTEFSLPESLIALGNGALYNCTSLSFDELNLPNLTSLGQNAFYGVKIKKLNLGKVTTLPSASWSTQNYGDNSVLEEVIIPETITIIPSSSFLNYTSLHSINLENVETIESSAFNGCSALEGVNLGNNLTLIGESAFSDCTVFDAVLNCTRLTSLGTNAFKSSGVTRIDSLGQVTNIPVQCFNHCSSLTSVNLPNIVTTGYNAFSYCTSLAGVLNMPNATSIGESSFRYTALTEISLPSVVTIGTAAFGNITTLTKVNIKNATTIGNQSFGGCTALTSVELGENTTEILYGAFSTCPSLTDLICHATTPPTLGSQVLGNSDNAIIYVPAASLIAYREAENWINYATRIFPLEDYMDGGIFTFADPAVEAICVANWDSNNSTYMSKGEVERITDITGSFRNKTDIVTFDEFQYFTGVTVVGNKLYSDSGFCNCTSLTSIVLPPSVTYLGYRSFMNTAIETINLDNVTEMHAGVFLNCPNLKEISAPNLVSTLERVFDGCTSLQTVRLDSITTLYNGSVTDGIFYNCTNLTDVYIPNVTVIGGVSFYNCSSLSNLTIDWSKVTFIGRNAFYNCPVIECDLFELPSLTTFEQDALHGAKIKKIGNLGNITSLPACTSNSRTYGDKSVLEEVVLPSTITKIAQASFYNYVNLKNINLSNITVIENNAFNGCSSLETVDLSNVTTILGDAFKGCSTLNVDKIGNENLTTIQGNAFYGCTNLGSEIDCPNLTTLGNMAFNTSGITKITNLGNTITSFGEQTFSKCTSLKSIVIPDSILNIGYAAFSNCTSLGGDLVFTNATELNQQALEYTAITSLYAPVATLFDYYCCRSCKQLHTVRLPSITSLGNRALQDCTSLTTLEIGNSCTQFEYAALSGCSSLTSLTLPSSLEIIAQSAFQNTGLTFLDIPATVTEIGSTAFAGSKALTGVIVRNTTPPTLGASAFNNTSECPIYVPDASVATYQAADGWSTYASRIKGISEYNG